LILPAALLLALEAHAGQVYLTNGDRITGKILSAGEEGYTVRTEAMQTVVIRPEFVRSADGVPESEEPLPEVQTEVQWNRQVAAGFDRTRGNTDKSALNSSLSINRKTLRDEWDAEAAIYYAEDRRQMNDRRYEGLLRYAFSFGRNLRWYEFNKLEAAHDRFADIEYRLTPTLGLGCWFFDEPTFKLMVEGGGGADYTDFRTFSENKIDWIASGLGKLEWQLSPRITFSEKFTYYPSVTLSGEYRFRSQSDFDYKFNKSLSVRLSLIDTYNSNPSPGIERSDLRLESKLSYRF